MIRVCLKCNAFYADESLAFCLADGTPLANLEPGSDSWRDGIRIVEEKQSALKKLQRKLKWRRVMMSTLTILMMMMVLLVVAANTRVYLKPPPALPGPLAVVPAPTENAIPMSSEPTTPTTVAIESPAPSPGSTPTSSPTPTPSPQCSSADETREGKAIIVRHGAEWRKQFENDPPRNVVNGLPLGYEKPTLGPIGYDIKFSNNCRKATVTATLKWRIATQGKVLNFAKRTKRFSCERNAGAWKCP